MASDNTKYKHAYNKEHYYKPSVYFPLEYKEKLKKAAEKHTSGSVSQLIIRAVDEFFEKNNK